MQPALTFSSDFKIAHCTEPWMFFIQVIATAIAGTVQVGVQAWMFINIPGMCSKDSPPGFIFASRRIRIIGVRREIRTAHQPALSPEHYSDGCRKPANSHVPDALNSAPTFRDMCSPTSAYSSDFPSPLPTPRHMPFGNIIDVGSEVQKSPSILSRRCEGGSQEEHLDVGPARLIRLTHTIAPVDRSPDSTQRFKDCARQSGTSSTPTRPQSRPSRIQPRPNSDESTLPETVAIPERLTASAVFVRPVEHVCPRNQSSLRNGTRSPSRASTVQMGSREAEPTPKLQAPSPIQRTQSTIREQHVSSYMSAASTRSSQIESSFPSFTGTSETRSPHQAAQADLPPLPTQNLVIPSPPSVMDQPVAALAMPTLAPAPEPSTLSDLPNKVVSDAPKSRGLFAALRRKGRRSSVEPPAQSGFANVAAPSPIVQVIKETIVERVSAPPIIQVDQETKEIMHSVEGAVNRVAEQEDRNGEQLSGIRSQVDTVLQELRQMPKPITPKIVQETPLPTLPVPTPPVLDVTPITDRLDEMGTTLNINLPELLEKVEELMRQAEALQQAKSVVVLRNLPAIRGESALEENQLAEGGGSATDLAGEKKTDGEDVPDSAGGGAIVEDNEGSGEIQGTRLELFNPTWGSVRFDWSLTIAQKPPSPSLHRPSKSRVRSSHDRQPHSTGPEGCPGNRDGRRGQVNAMGGSLSKSTNATRTGPEQQVQPPLHPDDVDFMTDLHEITLLQHGYSPIHAAVTVPLTTLPLDLPRWLALGGGLVLAGNTRGGPPATTVPLTTLPLDLPVPSHWEVDWSSLVTPAVDLQPRGRHLR
ncbi:hypothetical protein BXZ70DRAFT_1012814 [Cristinia sonorae]|uniref:Uncharacterized protein n=1 Tax=Cristinia sonorae TaxID=1940300 RepID=A0A8K0UG01_9AGAR|nr:hypothetical protein BXZ70DRAFT_1012814 [Cristinia sonorae]